MPRAFPCTTQEYFRYYVYVRQQMIIVFSGNQHWFDLARLTPASVGSPEIQDSVQVGPVAVVGVCFPVFV